MNIDATKINLGPCFLTFDSNELGATAGGVNIIGEMKTREIKCDQSGETVLKEIVTGASLQVQTSLLEMDLAKIGLFPNVNSNTFYDGTGLDLLDVSKALVVTPVADEGVIWTIAKAALKANFTINNDSENPRALGVTFSCYPDTSATRTAYGYPIAVISELGGGS